MQSSSTSSRFKLVEEGSAAGDVGADDDQQSQLGKGTQPLLGFGADALAQQAAEHHGQSCRDYDHEEEIPDHAQVSSSTTEPHSSRSVSGRITGESMVSNRIMDRHSSTLPPPMTIHIREDTAAGEPSISTRLRV